MGDGLADGRPDFEASGSEWRTPPLWGLGLVDDVNGVRYLLHDGRAAHVRGSDPLARRRGRRPRRRRSGPLRSKIVGACWPSWRRCEAARRGSLLACAVVMTSCGDDGPSRADVLGDYGRRCRSTAPTTRSPASADAVADRCRRRRATTRRPSSIADVLGEVDALRARLVEPARAMSTGPVMERRSDALIDWPVRAADIESFVESVGAGAITPEVVAKNVGADTRGLTRAAVRARRRTMRAERLADAAWCAYVAAVAAGGRRRGRPSWRRRGATSPNSSATTTRPMAGSRWSSTTTSTWSTSSPRSHAIWATRRPTSPPIERRSSSGVADVWSALGPLLGDDLAERLSAEIEAARAAYAGR